MQKNIPRLYFFSFFTMFFVSLPVWVPYFQGKGFSMQDVFVVQAVFACAVALFEVPTGYFCDLYGRKNTLVFGGMAYALAFTWLAFAESFWGVIAFELGAALAFSLISGADVALLYDSLAHESQREDKTRALGNMQFAQLISEAGGAVLGGVLAGYALSLPFQVQAVLAWFPLIIALTLTEGVRQKMTGTHRENFGRVFKHVFTHSPEIRRSFINLLVWGLATFFAVWMLQKHWETQGVPVTYFGYLWAAGNLMAALSSKSIARLRNFASIKTLTLIGCAFPVAAYLGMGLLSGTLAVSFFLGIYLGRGFIQVIMREEFNHHVPNEFRATANSIQSFMFRGVFAIFGPGVGWALDHYGVQTTMLIVASVFGMFYLLLVKQNLKLGL
ncbi:MAG: MFS transporter [Bacteriovoracia bacterium]